MNAPRTRWLPGLPVPTLPTVALPILALLTLALSGASTAAATPDDDLVRLHPDLPAHLGPAWIARLDLFPDVAGLRRVVFERAVWGGVVARLGTAGAEYERSLPARRWQLLRERAAAVLAGEPPPLRPSVPDSTRRSDQVWPEGPPPPAAPARPATPSGYAPVRGRWLAVVEIGARLDVTGFNEFFGPMGQIGVAFAYGVTRYWLPHLGFYAGFGNMRSDFEDAFGDGRTNAFGFTLTSLQRIGLGGRHSLFVEVGGGYHLRSLYWGSAFLDPATGRVYDGQVIEQKDFGWTARVGWQWHRAGGDRPRLLDVGLGVHAMPADQWFFATENAMFEASHRDTWVVLAVRFWDGL
jgi:hypothetical protein